MKQLETGTVHVEQRSKINPRSQCGRNIHRYAGIINVSSVVQVLLQSGDDGRIRSTLSTPATAITTWQGILHTTFGPRGTA